jgi:protein-S-isoprenylcysteine O-methyltransferase Ste14
MVGGLLALLAMKRFFSYSPIVIALQVIGLLLMVWARIVFGRRSFHLAANPTSGGLVTRGPYQCIRHPIYTGMCLVTLAGVAGNWSWPSALCGGLVLVCAAIRIFCEEALVSQRYPDYAQYSASTWRMIPYVY